MSMKSKIVHVAERSSIRISNRQKQIIQEFLDSRKTSGGKSGRGLDEKTLDKYECLLYRFIKFAGSTFDLKKANRTKMKEVMGKINASNSITASMRRKLYIHVKVFYKWLQGDDETYPKSVGWMKAPEENNRKISPKDLFTEEEIKKMIDTADNPRDKAVIALLADSAMRPVELLNLKMKDVELEDKIGEPSHVNAYGKTEPRKIPILFSAPFLARYIKGISQNGNDPDMPLWRTIGHWSRLNRAIGEGGLTRIFWDIVEKAGIRKRASRVMCPYLFRHTKLTMCAKTMSQQELNAFAGWTPNSGMAAVYIHLAQSDIDNAVLKMNGVKQEKKEEVSKIQPKACPKCKVTNAYDAQYCDNCGSPMDAGVAMAQVEREKQYKEGLQKLVVAGVDKALADRFGELAERYNFAKAHNKKVKSIEDLDDVADDMRLDKRKKEDEQWDREMLQLDKRHAEELTNAGFVLKNGEWVDGRSVKEKKLDAPKDKLLDNYFEGRITAEEYKKRLDKIKALEEINFHKN